MDRKITLAIVAPVALLAALTCSPASNDCWLAIGESASKLSRWRDVRAPLPVQVVVAASASART